VYVAIVGAFFAIALLYAHACDSGMAAN